MLLNYTLFLIFQFLEAPNLPVHRSVYICLDDASNFVPSTHFVNTFMLI